MKCVQYKAGYKYQLTTDYIIKVDIVGEHLTNDYVTLHSDGLLVIERGYAWDGPSGPTIDTLSFMRGSLVHDVLYQLIRKGLLKPWRKNQADILLKKMCIEDGMWKIRAWWVYQGVKNWGRSATLPKNIKETIFAPKGCK